MSRSRAGLLSCVVAGCQRPLCGRSTACSRWCLHWRCVTGASHAIRRTSFRSRVPREGKQIFLTHSQLDALADAAGRERLVILFLGYTGVRYGEMAALRVRNLDLIKRRALIAEAVADVSGRAVFDTPKNHQRRAVPLPRFLADELAEYVAGKGPDDYVFAAEKGGVLHLRNFRRNSF